jgi:hypothetical protein
MTTTVTTTKMAVHTVAIVSVVVVVAARFNEGCTVLTGHTTA